MTSVVGARAARPAASFVEPEVVRDILTLRQGEHLCLIYDDDPVEQLPALLPFLHQGLENGEQCIYVADDLTVEHLREALEQYGVDVALETSRDALLLWTRAEWRPQELDSATKEAEVRSVIDKALAFGFKGIRFGVEMTWTLGPEVEVERLTHWEATINNIFTPEVPARIICQYSRKRLSGSAILAGLRTHPTAVVGREVCPNPYYEAPFILGEGARLPDVSDRAGWMIAQLRWARTLEDERNQRLRSDALRAQAEAMERERDALLATIAHQMKYPVTALANGLEGLKDSGEDRAHRAAVLDLMEDLAQQLSRLLNELEAGLKPHIPTSARAEHLRRAFAMAEGRSPTAG